MEEDAKSELKAALQVLGMVVVVLIAFKYLREASLKLMSVSVPELIMKKRSKRVEAMKAADISFLGILRSIILKRLV
jgi:hypothetical protein